MPRVCGPHRRLFRIAARLVGALLRLSDPRDPVLAVPVFVKGGISLRTRAGGETSARIRLRPDIRGAFRPLQAAERTGHG
jgi:hypothetical protein